MAKQTVTLRLDVDDLTFLSQLDVPGATNISEKLRALIDDARRQEDGTHQYGAALDFSRRLLAGPERRLREAELSSELRSELLGRLLSWLPDMLAVLLSSTAMDRDKASVTAELQRLERAAGERMIGLTDAVLQLAVSGFPGCYEPHHLSERARAALRLARADRSGD
ncbi:hypothetical protein A167_00183 [Alcanivorax sp. S71-1-4]|jgi:hypothetical protein|uniref:hypothetical protein n=1 Tax=Alcanivorax sp. S71-1-4 TaxID=1177159 RepID=UPI00135CF39E|nr:hypothetical protein [Alcanivorax sp. S71-1-4]KAF0811151.1 hypothetical protein A167_00183 [Alcanivorax sp. S71-1-4]